MRDILSPSKSVISPDVELYEVEFKRRVPPSSSGVGATVVVVIPRMATAVRTGESGWRALKTERLPTRVERDLVASSRRLWHYGAI